MSKFTITDPNDDLFKEQFSTVIDSDVYLTHPHSLIKLLVKVKRGKNTSKKIGLDLDLEQAKELSEGLRSVIRASRDFRNIQA